MKKIIVIVILGILSLGGLAFGSERITIRRERTPDREYYQQNSSGGTEKVKEYRNGQTVKEDFRYEEGKGIIKYNEPVRQPQNQETKEKSRGK